MSLKFGEMYLTLNVKTLFDLSFVVQELFWVLRSKF